MSSCVRDVELVIRNTFLELYEDSPSAWQAEAPRVRTVSDLTHTKVPVKVSWSNGARTCQLARHRLNSKADEGASFSVMRSSGTPSTTSGFSDEEEDAWSSGASSHCDRSRASNEGLPAAGVAKRPLGAHNRAEGSYGARSQLPCPGAVAPDKTQAAGSRSGSWGRVADSTTRHQAGASADETTAMVRGLPRTWDRTALVQFLDSHGFQRTYDFVYLPMDFHNSVNLGYALINFLTHGLALAFLEAEFSSEHCSAFELSWAHPIQGLAAHVDRYRSSPVMHSSVPDEYKPALFSGGRRVAFPDPIKPIKAPKLRNARKAGGDSKLKDGNRQR